MDPAGSDATAGQGLKTELWMGEGLQTELAVMDKGLRPWMGEGLQTELAAMDKGLRPWMGEGLQTELTRFGPSPVGGDHRRTE